MKTACLRSLDRRVFEEVYEPAEDSFLFLDALEQDLELLKFKKPNICLEIGSGSGVVISSLAKVLGNSTFYLSTDINLNAGLATKLVSKNNGVCVDHIATDLVTSLLPRLKNAVDILLFNPPYVVTPNEEMNGDNLQIATAGGAEGCQTIYRFLELLPHILSQTGICYLVCIKENKPEKLCRHLTSYGIAGKTVLSRRCGIESLHVIRFQNQ